nr:hypothetical protein [Methylomarinum sp. Ch1-1]MDP4518958.1 hypothetical protein [Methylomarinum sp. Ch1-1]MDP4523356.1 hypothetical protein [Methylomarinum sp. Ch1-1]
MDQIAQGKMQSRVLLDRAYADLKETLKTMPGGQEAPRTPCPVSECDGHVRRLESRKKKGVFFWACSNRDHALLSDNNGKPGEPFGN